MVQAGNSDETPGKRRSRGRGFAQLTVGARDDGIVTGMGIRTTDGGWPGSDGGVGEAVGFVRLTVAARDEGGGDEAEDSHN
jgi:hypothetical protein